MKLFGTLLMLCAPLGQAHAMNKPNVLFIAVDDLNDWVGCLGGHPQAKTPNIDRLAERSVLFTNAHCQAPICNPSRASLMLGKYPSNTGIYYLAPQIRDLELTKDAVTLPQYFAAHGYATMAAGKVLHGNDQLEFDEYAGKFGGFGPRPEEPLAAGQTHPLWDWGAYPERDEEMPDAKIAAWTGKQLKKARVDEPFFLGCGFYRPHVPMYAPKKWFDLHPLEKVKLPAHISDDFADIPDYGRDLSWSLVAPRHRWMIENDQWKHAVQSYLASVSFVDAQVGKVLDALDESAVAGNTIVVLWSDHGFHLGTKESWGKRSLWEDGTRVTLMISAPGVETKTTNAPVGLIDLYPTLVDLCGLEPRDDLDGLSLRPLLMESGDQWSRPALTSFGQNNHALRSERWRYIVYADGSEELYDHQNDPHEFTNVIGNPEHAAVVAAHRKHLPKIKLPAATGSKHADARPGSAAEIPEDRKGN